MKVIKCCLFPVAAVVLLANPFPAAAQLVFSAGGAAAADIQSSVDAFRAGLGTLNPNVAGSFGSGRREINWDGVPDNLSAPNNLPANFFNVNSPRGAVFGTVGAGTGFQVSADSDNPTATPVQFGNIDPIYPVFFEPFSQQRLFTAVGSSVLDVSFFVAGSTTPALSRGFGSVFSDVDLPNTTSIQFFDAQNGSLGTFFAASVGGNQTFSFLGVSFADPVISRVRITSGNQVLAAGNMQTDLTVMDDFIYGEPIAAVAAVPDAGSTAVLFGLSLAALFFAQHAFSSRRLAAV